MKVDDGERELCASKTVFNVDISLLNSLTVSHRRTWYHMEIPLYNIDFFGNSVLFARKCTVVYHPILKKYTTTPPIAKKVYY